MKEIETTSLLKTIAEQYDIPYIGVGEHDVWFFRTKAGQFYQDFQKNNFIALGWDLLSPEFGSDIASSRESKKDKIKMFYPEEKRPGLILSQMEIFYSKMKTGDLVVIPSEGGKEISIGKLGELQREVKHKIESEEYPVCTYVHKRSVEWIKVVDVGQDIYLSKALRAQQTISDISSCGELVFRNLFPVYIYDGGIHITLQRDTNSDLNLSQNVELQYNCLIVMDAVAALYGKDNFRKDVMIKTAVGSPGFLEIILPAMPISAIATVFLIRFAIGKIKTNNGTETGILALASKFNEFINDYHNRKKVDAETYLIQMQAEKTRVEIDLMKAQINEMNTQREQKKSMPPESTNVQEENEKIALISENKTLVKQISESSKKIREAAAQSDIFFDGERVG